MERKDEQCYERTLLAPMKGTLVLGHSLLLWRALGIGVGAKNTTIAFFRLEDGSTLNTRIKILTGVQYHMYLLFCSGLRACYYGSSSHRIFPSFLFIRANNTVHLHSKNETVPSPANISEEQICQRID
jgi:hypothetical protein